MFADLQIVSVQVGVKDTGLMKAMQFDAEILPEFLVAGPLCNAVRERSNIGNPYRQQVCSINRAGAAIASGGGPRHGQVQ